MNSHSFSELTYQALLDSSLMSEALKSLCTHKSNRILDLGCGVGKNLFQVAAIFPHAHLVGVDISSSNIQMAKDDLMKQKASDRISFHATDYLSFFSSPFDIIYAESVMHLIQGKDEDLYQKISNDLALNGLLVVTMPYDCFYNRTLFLIRGLLKRLRSKMLDKLILKVAKFFYPNVSIDVLADRIPYMYLIPSRLDSDFFRENLEKNYQLKVIESKICHSPSIAKPKHKLIIFKKISS